MEINVKEICEWEFSGGKRETGIVLRRGPAQTKSHWVSLEAHSTGNKILFLLTVTS